MRLKLNQGQQNVVDECVNWYYNSSEQVFQISGAAGTGKTTVLLAIIERLGIPINKIVNMSYVGCAALNMRLHGLYNARTIHSSLYELVDVIATDSLGNVIMDNYLGRPKIHQVFRPRDLIGNYNLIIVDEAGMVPMDMREVILRQGLKVIAIGDLNQLKPVFGEAAFLRDGKVHILTEIMRQGKNSSIIELSQRALNGLPIHAGYYPNDVLVIEYDELTSEMIMSANMVICGKNATKDYINDKVRREILNINSELPLYGERLMCVKNNYQYDIDGINLVNGLCGMVMNNPDVSNFDGKSFRLDFLPDLGILPFNGIPIDYEYITSPYQERKRLKNRNYSNGELFEFAYASTVHKMQGQSIPRVVYIEEYMGQDIQNNLNYTAITRAKYGLIYVKQKRKFF